MTTPALLQATEIIKDADRYSDKYGVTTVLLILVIVLLLVAVWKVILPLFKEAQAKYDSAMKSQLEAQQAQTQQFVASTQQFLAALHKIEDAHGTQIETLMNTLKQEQRKNKK